MLNQPRDEWVRCKGCGHKLFKITETGSMHIETKCHSCKTINEINLKDWRKEK